MHRGPRTGASRLSCTGGPTLYLSLLLIPPLLWFGTVYLGSLFTLLAQQLLRHRRVHREDRLRADTRDAPAGRHAAGAHRHHPAHPGDGSRRHDCVCRHCTSDRQLHGALRVATRQSAVLCRRDAADVDQLPGEGICMATDPGEAGHPQLAAGGERAAGRTRCGAARFPASAVRRCRRRISACSSSSSTCGCRT